MTTLIILHDSLMEHYADAASVLGNTVRWHPNSHVGLLDVMDKVKPLKIIMHRDSINNEVGYVFSETEYSQLPILVIGLCKATPPFKIHKNVAETYLDNQNIPSFEREVKTDLLIITDGFLINYDSLLACFPPNTEYNVKMVGEFKIDSPYYLGNASDVSKMKLMCQSRLVLDPSNKYQYFAGREKIPYLVKASSEEIIKLLETPNLLEKCGRDNHKETRHENNTFQSLLETVWTN